MRHARAVVPVGIADPRVRGKRSRHSRCMRNPQFSVSGERPMECLSRTCAGPDFIIIKHARNGHMASADAVLKALRPKILSPIIMIILCVCPWFDYDNDMTISREKSRYRSHKRIRWTTPGIEKNTCSCFFKRGIYLQWSFSTSGNFLFVR